jgi:hypothetical protein
MYANHSFPIVDRPLVSLYIEVATSEGKWEDIDLSRVGSDDARVDTHQLWTAQGPGECAMLYAINT